MKHLFTTICIVLLTNYVLLAEQPPKPDVLLIMPDQMRGDCMSLLNHPVVQTPHLDQLAKEGVLFRRGYVTAPSCIPARYALMTGMSPHASGVVGFRSPGIIYPTMPQLLVSAGYATALIGCTMHQIPPEEPYGYQKRICGPTGIVGDAYDIFLANAAPQAENFRKLAAMSGLTFNGWEACSWPLADDLHYTTWVSQQSQRIIAETPENQPLFLTVSFNAPHPPLFPPKRLFDAYSQMDMPAAARGDWVDWEALPCHTSGSQLARVRLEGEVLHNAQAGYFGHITFIDEQIEPLIKDFKSRSEKAGRPWLIIFTADHGEMLGDHGYFRKCEPYEGSANVPFIVSGSPCLELQAGVRSFRPVCLEDIMPTLLTLAGVACPTNVDGVDLMPFLRGEECVIRDWLHIEHAQCYSKEQAFHALTDGRFKYIWRSFNGTEQLFDLEKDPKENRNLSKDVDYQRILERWRSRLIHRLADRPEGFSDGQRLILGRPYPPLNSRALAPSKPNVLFIAVDDLRPDFGCYGNEEVKSPHMDRLAHEGTLFQRAYCQLPHCMPSRVSVLTGYRPESIKNIGRVQGRIPAGTVTLPQLFRDSGYTTVSTGKIYHDNDDDPSGWVRRYTDTFESEGEWCSGYASGYQLERNRALVQNYLQGKRREGLPASDITEITDTPDDATPDGIVARQAVEELQTFKKTGEPFFLAVGFYRPHLPLTAPKKYWDMYDRSQIKLPANFHQSDDGIPRYDWDEVRRYGDCPWTGPMPAEKAKEIIHGYYASVTFVDAQIGKVLDELCRLGLDKNTIVVLWSDNGFSLGEHGRFSKLTHNETSNHVCMMLKAPWLSGQPPSSALVELVDIYPTLAVLCRLSPPNYLEGTSVVPLLTDSGRQWKTAVFSCLYKAGSRTIRTHRYRLMEHPQDLIELYDHENDPAESRNLAADPAYTDIVKQLRNSLNAGWRAALPPGLLRP